jgi:hypothetical protein
MAEFQVRADGLLECRSEFGRSAQASFTA